MLCLCQHESFFFFTLRELFQNRAIFPDNFFDFEGIHGAILFCDQLFQNRFHSFVIAFCNLFADWIFGGGQKFLLDAIPFDCLRIALLHLFGSYGLHIMRFPSFNAVKFFDCDIFHMLRHMRKHSLEHFRHLCLAENGKIHFAFSLQNVINAGNPAFSAFLILIIRQLPMIL